MKIPVKLRYLRIAPRKVRLVADLIRGKSVTEAKAILEFVSKRAALPLLKLLKSAIASAQNNFNIDESELYISEIFVDEGPKLKRWEPKARGAIAEIQKKTSHVNIILETRQEKPTKIKKTKEVKLGEETTKEVKKVPKPKLEKAIRRPKVATGIRRIFRRKAF